MILAHAEAAKSISSAAESSMNQTEQYEVKKVGEKGLVELDQFKYTLNTYREPLLEVGDSL